MYSHSIRNHRTIACFSLQSTGLKGFSFCKEQSYPLLVVSAGKSEMQKPELQYFEIKYIWSTKINNSFLFVLY